jgi:ribosomal protein L3
VRELRGVYEGVEVGQALTVDVFEGVEFVDVVTRALFHSQT